MMATTIPVRSPRENMTPNERTIWDRVDEYQRTLDNWGKKVRQAGALIHAAAVGMRLRDSGTRVTREAIEHGAAREKVAAPSQPVHELADSAYKASDQLATGKPYYNEDDPTRRLAAMHRHAQHCAESVGVAEAGVDDVTAAIPPTEAAAAKTLAEDKALLHSVRHEIELDAAANGDAEG